MSVRIKTVLVSTLKSSAVTLLIFMVVCACMLFVDFSDILVIIIAFLLIGFNSYLGAYISTQHCRNNGIVQGLECGAVNFTLIVTLAVVVGNYNVSDLIFLKLLTCLLCGLIGGAVGVNTKKTYVKM